MQSLAMGQDRIEKCIRMFPQILDAVAICSTSQDALCLLRMRAERAEHKLGGIAHISLVSDELLSEAIRVCFERKSETAFVPWGE